MEVTHQVAMCNYRANRLACDAADRAIQTPAASAIPATCPSSTSTGITAAIASPRAPRRSRCARWPAPLRLRPQVGHSTPAMSEPSASAGFAHRNVVVSSERAPVGASAALGSGMRSENLATMGPTIALDQYVAGGERPEVRSVDQPRAERCDHDRELTSGDQHRPSSQPALGCSADANRRRTSPWRPW